MKSSSADSYPVATAVSISQPSAIVHVEASAPLATSNIYNTSTNHDQSIVNSNITIHENNARDYLSRYGWPEGLKTTFIHTISRIPIRYMIFDDSGSMSTTDGHYLIGEGKNVRSIECSRWTELKETVKFHCGLASAAGAPTEMRFLNMDSPRLIGAGLADDTANTNKILGCLERGPSGGTPLCYHIRDVANKIRATERRLRESGQIAAVLICTDGEASDGDLSAAMKTLEQLPVMVVVRLCTDDSRIVDYWNNVDTNLELNLDVLDDLRSEADEVYRWNPWLTYAEPLHRMREFGVCAPEMDQIDEKLLSEEEMRRLLALIFGGAAQDYPHPGTQWSEFAAAITERQTACKEVWNPRKKSVGPWVDMIAARNKYGPPQDSWCAIC